MFFSGVVFVLAMLGLLLVPSTIMRSLAVGAIVVAIASIAVALTLLPALLAALGNRIDALRLPLVGRRWSASEGGMGWRTARAVLRRPLAYALAAAGALVVLALPVFEMNLGEAGVSTLPDDLEASQGAILLTDEFPGESTDPVEVVIAADDGGPEIAGAVAGLRDRLAEHELVGRVEVQSDDGGAFTVITASIGADALSQDAIDLVRDLREDWIPAAFAGGEVEALVTGDTAETIDESDTMSDWLPIVVLFVLALSLLLITAAFRSVVVAVKAVVVNLLSVAAAYGVLVAVFQKGWGNEIFGFEQVDTIGFGVAVALLLDATLVRLILIPATMQLLGDRNWYLPSWLAWLPRVAFEGDRGRAGHS